MSLNTTLLLLASALFVAQTAAADCTKGDAACFCKVLALGEYKDLEAPLAPACKISYQHQGTQRYVHVYFPKGYDGSDKFPIWVHLHGVFWTTMGNISTYAGGPINGTDIIPVWDHTLDKFGSKAILVYPQSTGNPGTGDEKVDGQGKKYRQFWHIPFWRCSVGICSDPTVDDVAFIEKVVKDLPKRLKAKPGVLYLSGESAGGMMVDLLLCQSQVITSSVSAAVDMLGGLGQDYAEGGNCENPNQVPYLKLHGKEDPFITFDKQILVDGVNFLSAKEEVQVQAKMHGCKVDPAAEFTPAANGNLDCVNYCAGTPGAAPAILCGIVDVGHDTDHPHPGFVFEQAWDFFNKAGRKVSSTKTTAAPGAVLVNMTFADVDLSSFNLSYNPLVVKALSTITDVPTRNITVMLEPATDSAAPAAAAAAASPSPATGGSGNRKLLQAIGSGQNSDPLGIFQPAPVPEPTATPESAPLVATADASAPAAAAAADSTPAAPAAESTPAAAAADSTPAAPAAESTPAAATADSTPAAAAGAEPAGPAAATTYPAGAAAATTYPAGPATGVKARYVLSGDDAPAISRSLKQAAASGAMTGLLQEYGVVAGPAGSNVATAPGAPAKGLPLPHMVVASLGPNATAESVDLNPVPLTADTPQPSPALGDGSASAQPMDGSSSSGSSGGGSSSSGGLPKWAIGVIVGVCGGALLAALTACCCCLMVKKRKQLQEQQEEKFQEKRRSLQLQRPEQEGPAQPRVQHNITAVAGPPAGKDIHVDGNGTRTDADADVVFHTA